MQAVTTIGLDIAKSIFQVHAVDAEGNVVVRRKLKRRCVVAFFQKQPRCLVGIEACASSHHWARELQALGHTVGLMQSARLEEIHRAFAAVGIPTESAIEAVENAARAPERRERHRRRAGRRREEEYEGGSRPKRGNKCSRSTMTL
jgi:transposase